MASIKGWNLARTQLPLDTQPGEDCIRQTAYHKGKQLSNSIAYAVDTLPECEESESNDTIKRANRSSCRRSSMDASPGPATSTYSGLRVAPAMKLWPKCMVAD